MRRKWRKSLHIYYDICTSIYMIMYVLLATVSN